MQRVGASLNEVMCYAAEHGYIEIVKLCKEWGADNFGSSTVCTAANGHTEIAKLCMEWGAEDFEDSMCIATLFGITKLLRA